MNRVPFPNFKRPLIAILRGIQPDEINTIVPTLIECGFEAIEVPLNSPEPFKSIERAVRISPPNVMVGAGTVLSVEAVEAVANAGGRLVITPNVDPDVIHHAKSRRMVTLPGAFTPTEALLAIGAGATGVKFFPANILGPSGISAIRAVLPPDIAIAAVGGISETDFDAFYRIGISVFGLGSSLYKPGMTSAEVRTRARAAAEAYDVTRKSQ